MKKSLTALLFSLLAYSAWAEVNYANTFKQFIIQDNNINKCLFPEIYHSVDRGAAVVEQWWNDTENDGRLKRSHYLKLKMRLAQKIMPAKLADDYLFNGLSPDLRKQLERAEKRYAKTVSIKSDKGCQEVGKYATKLVEEYDEFNQKWRKFFPNP